MTRTSPIKFLSGAAALPLVALAVAGCGGTSDSTASAAQISTHAANTINVAKTNLGKILVDSKGRTLYLFKKDKGTTSTCFGACATNWPPERATRKPTVSSGLTASKAGTTKRSD